MLGPLLAAESYLRADKIVGRRCVPAATRCTPATASSPSARPSCAPASRPGWCSSAPPPTRSTPWATRSPRWDWPRRPACRACRARALADVAKAPAPRDRLPGAHQGDRRRRWSRHAHRARREEPESLMSSAANEAKSAFGDATLYMEKFIERARHIEIQVMADRTATWSTWASASARPSAATRS